MRMHISVHNAQSNESLEGPAEVEVLQLGGTESRSQFQILRIGNIDLFLHSHRTKDFSHLVQFMTALKEAAEEVVTNAERIFAES